jgi:hypothetical protein
MESNHHMNRKAALTGYYSSVLLAILTLITFGLAMAAIPNSGAFCRAGCFEYPYLDTLSEYPGDYLWMFPAIMLMFTFMISILAIHASASDEKKIFSHISLAFALVSTILLSVCYYIQITVVPVSLMNGETAGITLLTQYNPHGVFIAVEELGYIMMSFSFIFLAPVFNGKNRTESAVRWIYIIAFSIIVISFVTISLKYGSERQDRFEVMIISVDWLVLVVNGILISCVFRRKWRTQTGD